MLILNLLNGTFLSLGTMSCIFSLLSYSDFFIILSFDINFSPLSSSRSSTSINFSFTYFLAEGVSEISPTNSLRSLRFILLFTSDRLTAVGSRLRSLLFKSTFASFFSTSLSAVSFFIWSFDVLPSTINVATLSPIFTFAVS